MSGEDVAGYVGALFAPEDAVLRQVRAQHVEADLPAIHVSADEGKILHTLMRAIGARRVLEVGTLGGYSGIWLARALPRDGRLVTIEGSPRHAAVAQQAFHQAGLADRIDLLVGEARDTLATVAGPFDAVFLDADKAPLPDYFALVMPLLRSGGLLLCDNTFMDGRIAAPPSPADAADLAGMRAFNALCAADPRLVTAVIPVRDGLLVAVKVAD
ncbi:MAG TPA: O-methyltransferase [Gemmatimonadales bacterium]